jgi:putative tributyrin esterase
MKTFSISISIMIISFFLSVTAYSTEKNIKTLSHYSQFLGKEQKMNVYVPDSPGKHSVLYLLHGAYGSYVDWVEKSDIENIADKFNLIIVMPDGGQFGWYTDSPFEKENQYESYIMKELIPFIDSTFDTYAEKDGRGICGLSMGGYGAMKFASKYPDMFASASSMSGVLAILDHPDHWSMPTVFGSQKEHLDIWKENDLLQLAPALKGKVAIKFDVGIDDHTLNDNREYLHRLQDLGISFEYGEFPGTHNWDYWSGHIFEHLQFHSRHLKGAE